MKTIAKYKQIATSISDEIRTGRLTPGDPLPSINAYATREQVNRSTVKRAYDTLVDAGAIVAFQGKGYFVTEPRLDADEEPSELRVFWSYAHKDDERSGGAITMLRERIQAEYELQTGNEANIFQDTKDIGWGMDWRSEIDKSLGVTTFFIPILTPTYLRSPHCLAELRTAKARFEDLGFPEGVYPIEFVDCTRVIERLPDDDLATFLSDRQCVRKWMDLRSEDPSSSAYQHGIRDIVEVLLEKEEQWELVPELTNSDTGINRDEDDGPLDKLESINDCLSSLEITMTKIGEDIEDISSVFNSTTQKKQGGPRSMLAYAVLLSKELQAPSEKLNTDCKEYIGLMKQVDRGIDGIVELYQIFQDTGDEEILDAGIRELFSQVAALSTTIDEPFSQVDSFKSILNGFSRLAKALRDPCLKIDMALDNIISSKVIIKSWKQKLSRCVANSTEKGSE